MTAPPRRCHECGSALPTDQAVPDAETHGDDARASVVGGIPSTAPPAAQPADLSMPNAWPGLAQPAEPTATDDLAEQLRRATIVIYGKCDESVLSAHKLMQKAAALIERQAREIADLTRLQERNEGRIKAIVDDALLQRAERAERERDELRAARIAYASEFPTNTDGEPDTGSIHANIRALKAERDALREQLHLRTCERDEAQACITTSADTIAALRDRLEAAERDAARYRWLRDADNWTEAGPMPCVATFDSTIYGPELDAAIDAARAKVRE